MSCYSVKGKGWRYELPLNGTRYTGAWFATKKEAQEAETLRREELTRPVVQQTAPETPTDMDFLELVNRRLDHVKVYSSERHYTDHFYLARKWVKERRRIMRVLCTKAGVRYFRFHALRHFGASQLELANVPVVSIQRLLGHENRTTTELYLHSIGDSERYAIDVLDGNFSENSHTNPTQNARGYRPKSVTP